MIEREMEGGVVVIQPPEVHEHSMPKAVGGLVGIEEDVEVHASWKPKPSGAPKV